MALVNVVKCDINNNQLVYKYPSDDLRLGAQLVVYPAQTALFVKGGKICDEFTEGTYTIRTENIPILNKLINLPFGNESPFKAEVWFVSQINKLNMKWGTPQPIQLEDPKYGIIVPVRAFGQYGIKIRDPRVFLETINGNMTEFSSDDIQDYFRGKVISQLSSLISKKIIVDNVSFLDISSHLVSLSEYCLHQLSGEFMKFGVEVIDFSFMSINVSQDDPSFSKLKEAKDVAARLKITGKEIYQMERSFDVLEKAADNTGVGGQVLSMGAGLGVGVSVGNAMGQMASQTFSTNSVASPPPIPQTTYFIYVNGQQIGNQTVQSISNLLSQGLANANTLVWCPGMSNWMTLSQVPELSQLLNQQTPPPLPPTV